MLHKFSRVVPSLFVVVAIFLLWAPPPVFAAATCAGEWVHENGQLGCRCPWGSVERGINGRLCSSGPQYVPPGQRCAVSAPNDCINDTPECYSAAERCRDRDLSGCRHVLAHCAPSGRLYTAALDWIQQDEQEQQLREEAKAEEAHQAAMARTRAQKEQRELAARQAVVDQQEQERAARIAAQEREAQERASAARLVAHRIETAPDWVRWFRLGWPVPQWIIGGSLVVFAIIVFIGHSQFSSSPGNLFFSSLGIALLSLLFTYEASEFANGPLVLFATLGPAILFLLFYFPGFLRGWHYLFVRHPATPYVNPALNTGAPFDRKAAADAMEMPSTWATNPPPSYKSHHEANEAEILAQNVRRDTGTWRQWTEALTRRVQKNRDLAQAMAERERARAEYERLKKRVEGMKKDEKA